MKALGFVPDGFTYSILFYGHSRCGDGEAVLFLYKEANEKGEGFKYYACKTWLSRF